MVDIEIAPTAGFIARPAVTWDKGLRVVLPFPDLATPAGVSPPTAAEQKHYQQNNQ
jgi:hypothetical protein